MFAGVVQSRPIPNALDLLLLLERKLYLRGDGCASELCDDAPFPRTTFNAALDLTGFDLVVDLSSGTLPIPATLRVVAPLYNGVPDELSAVQTLMKRELVELGIYDTGRSLFGVLGRSAAEDPNILSKSLDNVFCRIGALLLRAIEARPGRPIALSPRAPSACLQKNGGEVHFLVTSVGSKAVSRLNELCGRGLQWSIAWRRTNGDAICEAGADKGCAYARYPNNRGSYFADPFVISHGGRHYLFVEEFMFRSGKGVISVLPIEKDGTGSSSRVVLERPYHLSYPFVFEHGDSVFMIPESGAAKRVELYRARAFPDQWTLEAVLIDGVAAYDATLCEHSNRLWLFMATTRWQSSSWDTLEVFHAPKLHGPWTPLEANPVFIDPVGARPGGRMYHREQSLWRPAQDNSAIYGGGLALCRIDQLAVDGFRQTVVSLLAPSARNSARGVHTLNYADGLEAIDYFGSQSSGGWVSLESIKPAR
jgi:hypothetical protein